MHCPKMPETRSGRATPIDTKEFDVISARKNIFACLFNIHNTISLSRHEQVCLSGLSFERYFSH